MKEILSTITSKGQVTIPVEVRKHLRVERGDKLVFALEEGRVELKTPKYPNVASLRGAAGKLKKPLNFEKMREIAREDYLKAKRAPHP